MSRLTMGSLGPLGPRNDRFGTFGLGASGMPDYTRWTTHELEREMAAAVSGGWGKGQAGTAMKAELERRSRAERDREIALSKVRAAQAMIAATGQPAPVARPQPMATPQPSPSPFRSSEPQPRSRSGDAVLGRGPVKWSGGMPSQMGSVGPAALIFGIGLFGWIVYRIAR